MNQFQAKVINTTGLPGEGRGNCVSAEDMEKIREALYHLARVVTRSNSTFVNRESCLRGYGLPDEIVDWVMFT